MTKNIQKRFTMLNNLANILDVWGDKMIDLKTKLEAKHPQALKALSFYERHLIDTLSAETPDDFKEVKGKAKLTKDETIEVRFKTLFLTAQQLENEELMNKCETVLQGLSIGFPDAENMLGLLEDMAIKECESIAA